MPLYGDPASGILDPDDDVTRSLRERPRPPGPRRRVRQGRRRRSAGRSPDLVSAIEDIDAAAYGITWGRVRDVALTLDEHSLELAKRPYDLRHAGISFWLASGVDPAECARRAGQSMQVLFRYYAKFLADARNHVNRLIEESMQRWETLTGDAEGA